MLMASAESGKRDAKPLRTFNSRLESRIAGGGTPGERSVGAWLRQPVLVVEAEYEEIPSFT